MKKKLWLTGICICALIIIFATNIYKELNRDKDPGKSGQKTAQDGSVMTAKEAVRLLKFLGIGEDKLREAAGLAEETEQPEAGLAYLKFGKCMDVLEIICDELGIGQSDILNKLSFDLEEGPDSRNMRTDEFLNLYESVLSLLPEKNRAVTEKTMFVLGESAGTAAGSEEIMVTDQGNFTYKDGASYISLYTDGILELADKSGVDTQFRLEDYVDCKIVALVSGSSLVYVKGILEEETVLHNVWITSGENTTVSVFVNNMSRNFNTRYKLSKEITEQVGDLVIQDKKIIKISIKPDKIGGKVLVANQDYIEIEGYGKVDLDEFYKIYKIYDELSMEVTNSILVGYEATDFVVADGKIVAALIKETIKAEDVRVLIKTTNYKDIYHEQVQLTADKDFTITAGDVVKSYKAGAKITINPGNKLLKEGRMRVETKSENGKITLLSVKRSSGNPAYRGAMEVEKEEGGLIVINELSIEEYLYAVIPSEMPSNYGQEALKVQAICARSYAYNQLFLNSYSEFGAHIDDSVNYQVYNNIAETEDTILAVKDTYGKVIRYQDAVITAYYFSTSCGHTASLNEVWNSSKVDYLVGRLQTTYDIVDGKAVYASTGSPEEADYSSEDVFRDFILNPPEDTYDSKFAWYRWDVTISKENLKKSIDKSLAGRYKANPDLIQTLVGGSVKDNPKYESRPVSTIGTVKDLLVSKREKSGILSAVILVGSECTIKVESEYNIRTLLAPIQNEITRQDGSTVADLSMLPSAFFVMDKSEKNITFHGGGYGHGVGLSQNGVKAMADSGKDYEEIINHYYTGTDIGLIY